ncbi:golgin subfamily A member 4 [Biomphalaria glabrata]|nr:golgin subfamily A member 4-like [Biomphalaria glabrata]
MTGNHYSTQSKVYRASLSYKNKVLLHNGADYRLIQHSAQFFNLFTNSEKRKPGYLRTDVFQQASIPPTGTDRDTERRARSVSPSSKNRNFIPSQKATLTANSNLIINPCLIKQTENADITESTAAKSSTMDNTIKLLHQSEMEDLKSMRHTLSKTRQDLTQIEHTLLDTRELSEDAKSGLMMLEFKRGIVSQDLERLNEEMKRKQGQLTALDTELQNKLEDLKTMKSLAVTKEECLEVKNLKEENRNLKNKLRNAESLQAERDELIQQLDATKEELFREQKHNRLQTVEVQEEMESLTSKVEEIQVGWAEDQDQLAKLQQAYRQMEKEKNELIKGKAQEYEQMKMSLKEEVNHIQQRMGKELSDLGNEVTELRMKVGQLTTDNASKDIQLKSLKEQIEDLQTTLAKERQEKSKAANNYKTALGQLKKEMSTAVSKMKDSMFLEKQKAVEGLKNELEQERRELVKHHEDRLNQIMEDHLYQIAEKESQISNLHEVIRCQERQIQTEIDLQVHEALLRERTLMEQETEWQLKKEREDNSRRINELAMQCERDKQVNKDLQAEVGNLKKELEEQKRLQRESSKEKLLAVSKAKEQMKQQNNAEIERVKFNINQEHEHEFDQLREQLRMKEDEATQLCLEKQAALEREKQILQVLEQTERLIIGEINEECQKLSRLLGITVHNLSQSNYKPELSDSRQNITSRCIPVITSAMANLRSCNDHISNHVEELNAEVESLRSMMDAVIKEKEEAVESCKLDMERQKTLDLEMLKEKLLKDHVHEMSRVIQECASTNTQLRTNSEYLQRYGDAAMLEALQAKEDELHSLEQSMAQWKSETEEKFSTQLQLMMAKEREKYQAVQHHTTREQNRINDLQKREIERLEAEVEKLSMSQVKSTNKLLRSPSPTSSISQMSDSLSVPLSNPMSPGNLKSSQQYLQARIQQLQADNAALRKQRLRAAGQLGSSPTVTNTKGFRAISPKEQARISSPDCENVHWLTDKIKQGEKEAIKVKEQAKMNQKILNNRMDEMARLQNTLITQNQELQELERAYNDLHKHYNSRPSSPSRNLNVTV